jgi:LuxR family transcriptional regulator, maltose regulon positive regulatory protein
MSWSTARANSTALDRLESGMMYRLVLIVAPQGAGKTRLFREWVWERSKKDLPAPAWVALEQLDNDIEIFLQHLIAAFAQIEPALESRLKLVKRDEKLPAIQNNRQIPPDPGAFRSGDVLIDLINLLAEIPQEIVLILDEVHLIKSLEVHQAISFFIDYLPRNVHVFLAVRSQPPFRIAHLRARREMIEIGPELFLTSLE